MKFFFVFFLLLPQAFADSCVDAKRVQTEILSHVKVTQTGAVSDVNLCDESNLTTYTYRALLFLKDLPSIDLPKSKFNANFITTDPATFLFTRVKEIQIDDRPGSEDCSNGALAFVFPTERDEKIMHICRRALDSPLFLLSAVLLHEARHLDGPEYAHQVCRSGDLSGQFSCDASYQEGGSYAINLEYQVKVARSDKVSPVVRAQARTAAVMDFLDRFNELPLDLQTGALLQEESGALKFFDGEKEQVFLQAPFAQGISYLMGGLLNFLDAVTGNALVFDFSSSLSLATETVLSKIYRTKYSVAERETVLDMLYANAYACILRSKTIDCVAPDRTEFSLSMENLHPKRFLYTAKSQSFPVRTAALVTESGDLYWLPGSAEELKAIDPKEWKQAASQFPFQQLAPFVYGSELGLGMDGKLQQLLARTRKWAPVDALKDKKYQRIFAPFLWSKKLSEL